MRALSNKIKRNVLKRIKGCFYSLLKGIGSLTGFHVIPKHFYQPVPLAEDLTEQFFSEISEMKGVDLNERYALELLEQVFPEYNNEFRYLFPNVLPREAKNKGDFCLINSNFMAIDAHVYYALIRHFKPRQVIEVGGGNSSIIAGTACKENLKNDGKYCKHTVIDPYPREVLRGMSENSEFVKAKIQNVPFDMFEKLSSGDILFIDTSHVLRSGGDVQFEFLEVLPRLAPGVLVHFHDISLPKAYPRSYCENGLYWNEQYVLQAFMAFNTQFEVLWPGNYMMINYPDKTCEVFPEYHIMRKYYPESEPTSFWMRVKT